MMFGLSFFSRLKKSTKPLSSFRPWVYALETRLCPDGSLLSLTAKVLPGHLVQLSGTVTDSNAVGLPGATVNFGGATVGTTTTDANGSFSFTTNAASLGQISAAAVDSQQNPLGTAQALISVPSPTLTLSITQGARTSVTLSGVLADVDAGGQTITLSGVAAGSVVTDSTGHFVLTTDASALGAIDATTTDLWGKASNTAEVMVVDNAPVIRNFVAKFEIGNVWNFSGKVDSADPEDMVIRFGGVGGALANKTTTAGDDGTFSVSYDMPANVNGIANAITTDWFGRDSAIVFCDVG